MIPSFLTKHVRPLFGFLSLLTQTLQADPVVDTLPQAKLQEIFQHLQSASSLNAPQLTDEALNRAAIQGLLARLGPGFSLMPKAAATDLPTKLVSELLSPETAYLRPAAFTLEELPAADAALDQLANSTATTLILDLRSPAPHGNATAAAEWLSRFLPTGTALFEVRTAGQPKTQPFLATGRPHWTKPLVLLIDAETCNTAEGLAAVLRRQQRTFLIGTATTGQPIGYRTQPISDQLEMRWAESELLLDGTDSQAAKSSLFLHPLTPDLETIFDPARKRRQFIESQTTGMKPLAFEIERPRLNEAALVARTNPELEYRIAQSAHQHTQFDTAAPRDPVLQQALDYLTAQAFLKASPVLPPK